MKQLLVLLVCFAVLAGSCTKEYQNPTPTTTTNTGSGGSGGSGGGGGGGGGGVPTIGPVPSTFTQKVLIEEFTGEWCGYCPDGALILRDILEANGGKVIGASIHDADPFSIPQGMDLETVFNTGSVGWPSGMVNRTVQGSNVILDRGAWSGPAAMQLANTATCGLAMSSYLQGTDSLYVEVHCGFNTTLSGDYRLTVYLTENDVPGVAQHNYYDTPGSVSPDNAELNNIGDPITNWKHQDVLRKILTDELGNVIPSSLMVNHGEYVAHLSTTITGFNKTNCHIIAFINRVGTDPNSHQILNVQSATIYQVKDWD